MCTTMAWSWSGSASGWADHAAPRGGGGRLAGRRFPVQRFDDIEQLVWEKLICNVSFSGTCSVLGRTISDVMEDADAWEVASGCAVEAFEVALARHQTRLRRPGRLRARLRCRFLARPSMLLDLEAGRRTEVDFINGAIPRAGRDVGVDAPFDDAVSALVRALELVRSSRPSEA